MFGVAGSARRVDRCRAQFHFILDSAGRFGYNRIMRGATCWKLAFAATILPLPLLALATVLGSIGTGLGFGFIRYVTAILLVASGTSYLASFGLAAAYGFISRRPRLLLIPAASLFLIAIFVVALPDNVREEPWRTIDIAVFAGLIALNIAQVLLLRRKTPETAGGDSGQTHRWRL